MKLRVRPAMHDPKANRPWPGGWSGPTIRESYKVLFAVLGTIGLAGVPLVVFVMLTWGTPLETLVAQSFSPDRKTIAEIRQVLTPMHGGPDTIYVSPNGQEVYVRVYECHDSSAYGLHWDTPRKLAVTYSPCRPYPPAVEDDAVQYVATSWDGIEISYKDSGHVATR